MMKSKSNEPTKTKKAMKTMKKYLSMAALALVGAIMTGCSSSDDDSIIDNPQQPETKNNVVILTTTVGFDDAAGTTRALSSTGEKTFAAGETMALVYKNTGGSTVKVVSAALTDGNITGKSATFTFELTDPDKSAKVTYIYPAAMANSDGSINNAALNSQDGTLATLSSNLDLATYTGDWNAGALPTGTLTNQLAILAMTLKNDAGGSNITSSITGMTIKEGSNTYTITGHNTDGKIYVAIFPMTSATIDVTATNGTYSYVKTLTDKTYAASNGYNVTWKMAEVISGKFTVNESGKKVYFSKGNLRATGTTASTPTSGWTWSFATNQWDKIGNATANTSISGNGKISANGTVDLFGWSTSKTYLGIHNSTNNDDYSGDFVEWGSHADVTKSIGTGWRTLNGGEWYYLFVTRSTTSGKHYCKAKVNGVFGVILLPDDWSTSYYNLEKCDVEYLSFSDGALSDKITLEDWNASFVPHGAVFLPTTGHRYKDDNTSVDAPDGRLYYWSSTKGGTESGTGANANQMYIAGNEVVPNTGAGRRFGSAVRLVRDVK